MALDELRVWVEGDERVIRGVNENTTSENVMVALASATGKSGKFALLEKWRNFERILPRNGKPLMCLRMWGAHCDEVKFILKDNSDNSLKGHVVESLKHEIDDTSSTRDLSQTSYHRSSLETLQSIQARRLELLARDLEIMKQYSDYFTCGNCYSSFSEEIENDLAAKLNSVIKLELSELSENDDCERELERLKNLNLDLTTKLEMQQNKIHLTKVHASDLDGVSEKLYLILIHNSDTYSDNEKLKSSPGEKPQDLEGNIETQQEISRLKQQILVQTKLHCKQCEELARVTRSIEEVGKSLEKKRSKLKILQKELEKDALYYDLDENFKDDEVEASVATFNPEIILHPQSETEELIKTKLNQTIGEETSLSLLTRNGNGQRKPLLSPRAELQKSHASRKTSDFKMLLETEGVYV